MTRPFKTIPILGIMALALVAGLQAQDEEADIASVPESDHTASPEAAAETWRELWGEGTSDHRAQTMELEGQRAPAIEAREWIGGEAIDPGEPGEDFLLIAFWAAWNPDAVQTVIDVARAVENRGESGVRFVTVHPDEGITQMEEVRARNRLTMPIAIDQAHATSGAYCVDSYPDFHLIAPDGTLLRADVANDHVVELLDAALQEWTPSSP